MFSPGTHLKTKVFRGRTTKDEFIQRNYRSFFKDYIPISIPMGSVLVYNPGCVHFSPSNKGKSKRPVLITACLPIDAEPCIFFEQNSLTNKKKVLKFSISRPEINCWNNKDMPKNNPIEIISILEK